MDRDYLKYRLSLAIQNDISIINSTYENPLCEKFHEKSVKTGFILSLSNNKFCEKYFSVFQSQINNSHILYNRI